MLPAVVFVLKGNWLFTMEDMEKVLDSKEFERDLAEAEGEEKEKALKELKEWLYKENIRIQMERKKLKQEEAFFEKKMDILKSGFAQLDLERKKVERDKLILEAEKNAHISYTRQEKNFDVAEMLFQGVNSSLALKKRYKDLIKMFHPDNIAGDHEMVLVINKIYEELKQDYEMGKRA